MFKPERMMRLSAVVLQRDERDVLRGLGSGIVNYTGVRHSGCTVTSSICRIKFYSIDRTINKGRIICQGDTTVCAGTQLSTG